MLDTIYVGDCRVLMRGMIECGLRVDCVVTSPPYWGLRDYGVPGAYGLERTWLRHVARMRSTFRLVRELLADDGVMWLNYGDSYAGSGGQSPQKGKLFKGRARQRENICLSLRARGNGLKPKDLVGMPWRIALALQEDGWYLRSDVIWAKPNPMPESCTDRPTKAHEYLFLMSRSEVYHYDASAIAEPRVTDDGFKPVAGHAHGSEPHTPMAHARRGNGIEDDSKFGRGVGWAEGTENRKTRNIRSVWSMSPEPFAGAHFATFPRALVRRCILAGSRPGGIVFDPFMGSGTVAEVAVELGRRYVGCELNAEYAALFNSHRSKQQGFPV